MTAAVPRSSFDLGPLNKPQTEAVAHADGPLIVFAGAGSGKTRVITYRIANLIANHRVPPYRLLAVTFTNKAAQEMKARLERILGPGITHDLWVGTFHSVCLRLLRRHHQLAGLKSSFVIYDTSDQKAVMSRVIKQLDIDDRRFPPQKVLARIQAEKQEGRSPDQFEIGNYFDELIARCFETYEQHLKEANAVDFADLLLYVLRLAEDPESEAYQDLRTRFSHVLVDEFQDVNLVQYRLVRAFSEETDNICVVGDDDQSIYQWRGADIRNIRGFTRDYADATLIKLEQNYRSTGHIVSSALGVIQPAADRQAKELWTDNPDGELVNVIHCAHERDEAGYIVERIREHIARGLSPRKIAVFYRVHAQSRVLEESMRAESVPYQIIGGHKFFERAEIKDLLAYLRVLVNPQSDVDLLRIINVPPRKIGAKTIGRLIETADTQRSSVYEAIAPLCASDRIGNAAKRSLRAAHEMFEDLMRTAETGSPRELADLVLEKSGYGLWLQRQDNAEADARLDNLRELSGSIDEFEEEQADAGEVPNLLDYLARISLLSDVDNMKDVERVPMMTVHAAKGLEFDAVFISGMEERLFPLHGTELGEEDELEEERRLAYVAVTRARQELSITHTNTRMIYGQTRYNHPSRFLEDLPRNAHHVVATPALHEVAGRRWARTSESSWDEASAWNQTPSPKQNPPNYAKGERYVERDEIHDSFDELGGAEELSLRVGANVRHKKFGVGVVRAFSSGSDPVVTVKFSGWAPKRIKLSFLNPA